MVKELRIQPTVIVELPDRAGFLGCFYHQGTLGGVFVRGQLGLEPGTETLLEFVFVAEKRVVRSRGIVRWRRTQRGRDLEAGMGIEFLPTERRTRDLLLDYARGREVQLVRHRARRLPVSLTVEYASESVMLSDLTEDISEEGLFIASDVLLDVGTKLRLRLKPPGSLLALHLRGEVMWRRGQGRRGFGVRFLFDKPRTARRIREVIDRLQRRVQSEMDFRVLR